MRDVVGTRVSGAYVTKIHDHEDFLRVFKSRSHSLILGIGKKASYGRENETR